MTTDHFVSVREAAQILQISEKKIMDMIAEGKLQAYRIANQFLRLKKSEIFSLQQAGTIKVENAQFFYTPQERLRDFFFYNDFYIICLLIICCLLFLIFFTH